MTLHAALGSISIPVWTVGDRLRKARESSGLGQVEFAAETGVSRRSISKYEGSANVPPKSVLLLWQMRTGVPVEWLVNGDSPRPGGPGAVEEECTPSDLNREPTDSQSEASRPVIVLHPVRTLETAA